MPAYTEPRAELTILVAGFRLALDQAFGPNTPVVVVAEIDGVMHYASSVHRDKGRAMLVEAVVSVQPESDVRPS